MESADPACVLAKVLCMRVAAAAMAVAVGSGMATEKAGNYVTTSNLSSTGMTRITVKQ